MNVNLKYKDTGAKWDNLYFIDNISKKTTIKFLSLD